MSTELYEGIVIRPPSEASSVILQVTLGCSDNRCTFCPAYKEKKFAVKDPVRIEDDLRVLSRKYPSARRVFFADGDALIVEQKTLEDIFDLTLRSFPKLARIGTYGSVKTLERKTVDDLRALRARRLGIVYLGFETGDPVVYGRVKKYGSPEGNIAACRKVKEAGLTANVTVILGLGGKERSREHAVATASVLNRARPDHIAALTLMLEPPAPLAGEARRGEFVLPDSFEMLEELACLIEHLEDFPCLFFANHASNFYPVQARFPQEKDKVLRELRQVIRSRRSQVLRPDFLREL